MITRRKSLAKKLSKNPRYQKISTVLYPVLFGVLIYVLWETQVLHKMLNTDTFTLPLPSRIHTIIFDNLPKIGTNVLATVIVSLSGLVLGSLFGYIIAVIATFFPKWGAGGLAVVSAFNAIPIVALAPVMTNWTKDVSKDANIRSMVAKILVVMIVCIATMSINAFRGLNELKPYARDLMKSYAAKRRVVFWKLEFPNSLPFVFTALRVSVPLSVISAIVSEYFAEYITGVGRQIRENVVIAQYSTAWAYIVVSCLIGIVFYAILLIVESICLKNRKA